MRGFPYFLLGMLTAYTMVGYTFGRYLLSVLAPDMIDDGVISYQSLAIMTALSQFGFLFISLASGKLTQLIPPKTMILGSVTLTGLGLIVFAGVRSEWVIVPVAGLLGVLTATGWVPVVRVIQEAIDERFWGTSIAQAGCGTAYGIVATGVFVPLITASFHWSMAWLLFGVAAILMAIGGIFYMPSVPRDEKVEAGSESGATGFAQIRRFMLFFIMMFLSGAATMAYLTYIFPYLRDDLGMTASDSGMIWSMLGVLGMGSGILWGWIADRFSVRKSLLWGHVVLFGACALVTVWHSPTVGVVSCVLFGIAFTGNLPLYGSYAAKMVSSNEVVGLYGKGNFCLGLGGTVFNFLGGNIKSYTGSFELLFLLTALACFATVLLAMRLPDDSRARAEQDATRAGQPAPATAAASASGRDGI